MKEKSEGKDFCGFALPGMFCFFAGVIIPFLYGDYLIEPSDDCHAADFAGTRIRFGDDTFKTWEEIIEFFGRLGGQ